MSDYIKVFNNSSEQNAFRSSSSYIEPHVSVESNQGSVKYNKQIGRLWTKLGHNDTVYPSYVLIVYDGEDPTLVSNGNTEQDIISGQSNSGSFLTSYIDIDNSDVEIIDIETFCENRKSILDGTNEDYGGTISYIYFVWNYYDSITVQLGDCTGYYWDNTYPFMLKPGGSGTGAILCKWNSNYYKIFSVSDPNILVS